MSKRKRKNAIILFSKIVQP